MQCKEVALVLGKGGWTPLPNEVRAHIVICNSCLNLVANLREIVATTHQFSTEVEPPARVWLSLRKQLEEEGIIKTHLSDACAGSHFGREWHLFE